MAIPRGRPASDQADRRETGRPMNLPINPPPAPARGGWRLGRHSLGAALVLALITTLGFFRRTDPDFWWHLQAGRDILATGRWPTVDRYSFTVAGEHWVAHEWLWEAITAAIQDSIGYLGISSLLAFMLCSTFLLLYRVMRGQGVNEWVSAGLTGLAALMSLQTLTARPHAVTYLLVLTTVVLLERWRRGDERPLWWLVVLLIPWANLHGGYAIGLGLCGLTLIGEVVDAGQARRRPRLKTLLSVILAGGMAASLNPQGPFIHLFALSFLNRESAIQRYIQEWASPDFHELTGQAFGLGLLLLVIVGIGRRGITWSVALPVLAVTWLGLQGVRHVPLFALVALPYVAAGLRHWSLFAERPRPPEPTVFQLGNWLMVGLIVVMIGGFVATQPLAQIQRQPLEEWYPSAALAYLQREQPPGPIFNFDGWGGYLIARAPAYPVFIDGRSDLYGARWLDRYRAVMRLEPGWRGILDEHGIRLLLVRREQAVGNLLRDDPGWVVLVETETELLVGRR